MEESLEFTPDEPPMKILYPFNDHADVQKSNFKQILAVQRAHESRTIKMGVMEEYAAEMLKYQETGTVVHITPKQLEVLGLKRI